MSDFEKLCELLKIEPDLNLLNELVIGNCVLIFDWDENGNIKSWGTID